MDLNDNEGYLMFGSQEIYEKMQENENREEKLKEVNNILNKFWLFFVIRSNIIFFS